ncbi:family 78 glycoside hydrolase catalytic domain [Neolewinella lacunae]|uniref:alpha-L-rhamnosidase n=1 Tax=Neolewinella lacunae TaxID=1517758 RepID=A0A923PLY6_9BACT|nr:alpha-L-rhamnosidase [Neolewinella lacunae]MBC6996608.1 family 78 glycoside hydrolase catalytic domain [Neolewinella lacunae]MDN3634828.1 family 78 glycoside hydrolase catalytic domain [Neolewinella lacunae]
MLKRFFLPLLLLTLLGTCVRAQQEILRSQTALRVINPRVEYRSGNVSIDVEKPRFSWELTGEGRNRHQTAYELKVLNEREVVWHSGKVNSNATNQIGYNGQPLQSGLQYRWTVTSYDENDQASTVSGGMFRTGLLRFADWQGLFISHYVGYDTTDLYQDLYLPPARYLRREFTVADKQIKRATAYTTALGLYELSINGQKVGEEMFLPGWTDYDQRLYYQTFDVKALLEKGDNAIGVILADGWYAGYIGYALLTRQDKVREFYGVNPAFMGQIHVEYTDGTTEIIATDETWQSSTGPILEADILMGEHYDARLEQVGWDRPGFTPATPWAEPRRYTFPSGRLQAYPGDYVMPRETLRPVKMTEPSPGTYIYDLGKNIAGIIELKVEAPAGTKITIRYGELLRDEDGGLMTANLRKARATDTYVTRGGGVETWRPRFTYHGFQYVELTGLPTRPAADAVTGIALSSITTDAGEFTSSNTMNDQLFQNIKTTQAANFFEVPTDCPQRDERLGWTGDAHVFARSATYVADVAAFFTKWLIDLDDSQHWYGAYPNFAPMPFSRPEQYSPAWMDAGVIIPYTMHKVYGDTRVLEKAWAGMENFMAFQADASTGHLRPGAGNNWGDWLTTGPKTSDDFIASAFYGYDALLMARMATALGKTDRAAHYRSLFNDIKAAFTKKYLRPDGSTTEGTQTALALALYFDLYDEAIAPQAAQLLARAITENGDKFSTGFLGTKHVMLVLSEYGHHDLAYRLFQQTEYPSWGYSVVNGSTSIWERWNSYTRDADSNDAINAAMNSFSHYAFGSVAEWMFLHALGLETDGPGYRKLRIQPAFSREMDHLEGSYHSINGTISSAWKWSGDELTFSLTLPPNTTAEVVLPLARAGTLRESGKLLKTGKDSPLIGERAGQTLLRVGSGSYTFSWVEK